jgi:hypothetical protein
LPEALGPNSPDPPEFAAFAPHRRLILQRAGNLVRFRQHPIGVKQAVVVGQIGRAAGRGMGFEVSRRTAQSAGGLMPRPIGNTGVAAFGADLPLLG